MKYQILSIFLGLALLSACEGAFDVEGDYDIDSADRGDDDTTEVVEELVDDSPSDGPADNITSQNALNGQEIYIQECGTCHGDDAKGAQAWPLSIEGYFPIYGIVAEGQGTMSAIPLSEEDIGKVQAFLMEL